jgi:SAM-dependent methyltransferase
MLTPVAKPDDLPLDVLACPKCGGRFGAEPVEPGGAAYRPILRCLECRTAFPVRDGIPRLTYPESEENYGSSFEYQWSEFALEQFDSQNGTSISEERFFRETGWTPEWLRGKRIFEVGCGAGRFLEIAARYADLVLGIDVSGAIDVASRNLAAKPNVVCVQGSAFALPLRTDAFDGCYCIGVIQHTPDPDAAAAALGRPLNGGGRLALTAYERKPWTKLSGKYLARPLTRRLPRRILLTIVRVLMPIMFAVGEVGFRLPRLNRIFRFALPLADTTGEEDLSLRQRYRWATLDTFDALSPTYDNPVTHQEVERQLRGAGMVNIRRLDNPGVNLVAEKPREGTVIPPEPESGDHAAAHGSLHDPEEQDTTMGAAQGSERSADQPPA